MKTTIQLLLIGIFLFLIGGCCKEQGPFVNRYIKNPSFEVGTPGNSTLPTHWFNCGFEGETPPDLHSDSTKSFDVTIDAIDGDHFVGMVVRDNETWECIIQPFNEPISGDFKARFMVARSDIYLSFSDNFITPAVLRIIGVTTDDTDVILHETPPIIYTRWEEYRVSLSVPFEMKAIKLSPYYAEPYLSPYNGNVLIDLFEMY
jgi:hypothetical protein